MTLISIVVPCYNEEESLPLFADELSRVTNSMKECHDDLEFELILIDDGSSDGTLSILKGLGQKEWPFKVRWASFSRNFGKEAALYAGLERAKGDYVATMDADMQDPPSLLPDMYEILLTEDCDNVATRRTTRKGRISDADIVDGARDYRLMKRDMVDAVLSITEYNRFSKGIFGWVGFRTKWLEYENVERAAGETKWSFFSLLVYSIDGIVGFSTAPLSIASFAGLVFSFIAVVAFLIVLIRALLFGDPVAGWPSTMIAILFIGGLQMLFLGVIGQYLAKAYLELKHRPLYLVRETSDGE